MGAGPGQPVGIVVPGTWQSLQIEGRSWAYVEALAVSGPHLAAALTGRALSEWGGAGTDESAARASAAACDVAAGTAGRAA
jgi:hypothetical protein